MLPADPMILLSVVNTRLRDTCPTLEELCAQEGIAPEELTARLATVETSAYRLAESIKKTQKRANALKNITIPSYQTLVTEITNALEEKDREEFTRLKVIKRSAGK